MNRVLKTRKTDGGIWVICPICRRGKLLKLNQNTRADSLILYCYTCKNESLVSIAQGVGGSLQITQTG